MNRQSRQRFWGNKLTFLCSDAVLGLSGVVFMLAGVAATGEEEVFSIMSAGIFVFVANIPQMQRNYGPRVTKIRKKGEEINAASCTFVSLRRVSPLSLEERRRTRKRRRRKK